ncbi:MAG: hypothetical protein V3S40_06935 [Kiloniellales bacterium]
MKKAATMAARIDGSPKKRWLLGRRLGERMANLSWVQDIAALMASNSSRVRKRLHTEFFAIVSLLYF